jgi:hypothetical protein
MSLLELFCAVDDFCIWFNKQAMGKKLGRGKRGPQARLSLSEIMTILIHFHQSHYRDFKAYYTEYVLTHLRREFPGLVSYTRFVELAPTALVPLTCYLHSRFGRTAGIAFIDSTPLAVCHNKRIARHRVFAGWAKRGKSSMGYFFGFKLHLVINDQGELLAVRLTPANVDDRKPVPALTQRLWGKLFGDKGYLSQPLFEQLLARSIQLITPLRKNMQNRLMPLWDKLMARKRSLIETVNDQLKNISQIAHTRHRSVQNFMVNLMAGLLAYTFRPKKPALHFSDRETRLLPTLI